MCFVAVLIGLTYVLLVDNVDFLLCLLWLQGGVIMYIPCNTWGATVYLVCLLCVMIFGVVTFKLFGLRALLLRLVCLWLVCGVLACADL